MKYDGEKGNPSDVEGVGSISTDVARCTDGHLRTVGVMRAQVRPPDGLHQVIVSRRHAVVRAALASWFRNLMGGERIARSGVENGTMQSLFHCRCSARPDSSL